MKRPTLTKYLLSFPGAVEEYPFGPETAVYKVGGKLFALLGDTPDSVMRLNLKCDPEFALMLRASYKAIVPGYHMNKKHWNSVLFDGSLTAKHIKQMVEHSYELVSGSLPLRVREELNQD